MKKTKTPFILKFISWFFPKLETAFPWLAHRWFVNIFFTPVKYTLPPPEIESASLANRYVVNFEKKKIQVYEWGEGPVVLFVHGWMGRATQFRKFIPHYAEAGYKVIAFDATGHGKSEGKKSNPMEFAGVIRKLSDHYGGFLMIIGHSLGGVAVLHAINQGVKTDKVVMISCPTIGEDIISEFRKRLNASINCEQYFQKYILTKFGKPFEQLTASHAISFIEDIDLLIIHDEDDPEVSMRNPLAIIEKYPAARLVTTQNLGHTRILKDEAVINSTLVFLKRQEFSPVNTV